MATVKFKDVSPYAKQKPSPAVQDYVYQDYLKNLATKRDSLQPVVKLALFGAGRAGTIHLSNIMTNPNVKLLYIVDDLESKWSNLRDYWHLDNVTFLNSKQWDKVFNDPNVDAVIVASPTFTHETIVRKALEAKKSVFCEKPVAEDRSNVLKCYETAKKVGKPLFCAFNRRFDPSFSLTKERVRNGEIGHVHVIKTISRDSPLPSVEYLKTSGGIFHDCMVHDFDMIIAILGELPIKVAAQAHAHVPEIKAMGDYDTVVVTLYFPSGTLGMVDVSRTSCYGYDQRLEVYGQKGMITVDNERPNPSLTTQYGLQGATQNPIWYSFPSRYMHGYRNELNHFIDVVNGKAQMNVLPKETLAVSKVASACAESARTGKMVEIKWSDEELL
ncbi:uncharacterized oxidoreductase YrbE-like [Hylaeus anthracinus]|uniref:uncharacterized oxidoreductase YrbE-like n=1 Tax=Hylaeus anthracinus TaxID=313031 RepID=UPI0023B9709E|nr:uncharacterized oxidoreductase YrbE-like [Hylaeus anthracinus]